MAEPVLMFGVGAAKAGTSWLHRYLDDHPECHFRALKELQYFNTVDWGGEVWDRKIRRVEAFRDAKLAQAEDPELSPKRMLNKIRQLADIEQYLEIISRRREDLGAYRDYVFQDAGEAKLVGEVTPAYSLLSEERLKMMAGLAADVRFVYLLRDPVERLWSHVRMIAQERCREPHEFPGRAANVLRRVFSGQEDHIVERSDYAGALRRLRKAVAPEKLCVAIYEEIFAGDALGRICDFLGISRVRPDPASVVHAGRPLAMTEEQRKAAALWLGPQYDAMGVFLGQLPASWNGNLVRV